MTTLKTIQLEIIPVIEEELQARINAYPFENSQPLKEMLTYHMGWNLGDEDAGTQGKRIRPLITLLSAGAFGGEIDQALPGAVALEYLHNFTLIHDDIQDNSPLRHNRPTLWKKWGIAQAINAGDALFTIAQMTMLSLSQTCSANITLQAAKRLNQVCLYLTQGQYLDMAFEQEDDVEVETYLEMVKGKTAALIAFCAELGGWITGQDQKTLEQLSAFGQGLGLAFQIQDDNLGLWGDPELTGKSAASDLVTRKKTLPILYGLSHCPTFKQHWQKTTFTEANAPKFAEILANCGAKDYAQSQAKKFTGQAFVMLKQLFPQKNIYGEALVELTNTLLDRRV